MSIKVTLRKRQLPSGKITLYLDFYPAIRNPKTMQLSRREYLGIYLTSRPANRAEKMINEEKMKIAEGIRAQRELSLLNEEYGFLDKATQKMSFLTYFKSLLTTHDKKWLFVFKHFEAYVKGQCLFQEVTIDLCNGFRDYLLNTAKKLSNPDQALSNNSIAGYWSTFRAVLAKAYKEHYLQENINDYLDKIDYDETRREYLTIDEIQALYDTPCSHPQVKAASLFSILTGLRRSDILKLRWEDFTTYPDGGRCIRIKTEKTEAQATLPITEEAYQICGQPGTGLVFPDITTSLLNYTLKKWIKQAGITKNISFHVARHCNLSY